MHIDSQWKDHGLLTQLHGSFHPFNIKIENSKTNFYSRSKTNFHSRSKTNEGKEKFLNPKRCGGGPLRVQMDFTWTFEANTKCNNNKYV